MKEYVDLRVDTLEEHERVLQDQRLSKGVDSPILEERAGLEEASIAIQPGERTPPPPRSPINTNLIKTVTSAGTLSSVRTPKIMHRAKHTHISSSRRLFSQSGKSSQEYLPSTRRVNIDS